MLNDAAQLALAHNSYVWPQALHELPENTVMAVNRLWTEDDDNTLYMELRVDDEQARQRALGHSRMDDRIARRLGFGAQDLRVGGGGGVSGKDPKSKHVVTVLRLYALILHLQGKLAVLTRPEGTALAAAL